MHELATNIWRQDFPALARLDQQNLVYLDNAATSQKPYVMIKAVTDFYTQGVANAHRSSHQLAVFHTNLLEKSRAIIAKFLGFNASNLIFTKNATESSNLLAYGLEHLFKQGDAIAISALEHHANLLPWQQLARRKKLKLVILPIKQNGIIDVDTAQNLLDKKCKLIAISELSNVFGTTQPINEFTQIARNIGAFLVVDGAQGGLIKNTKTCADFYLCSAHKMYGPDGLGMLCGRSEALAQLKHFQTGGAMLNYADYLTANFLEAPHGFEAGTQATSLIYAFSEVIKYLEQQDLSTIQKHINNLTQTLINGLKSNSNIQILGEPNAGLVSFNVLGINHADLAYALNEQGILVRSGNHCAMPLFTSLNLQGAIRVSFAMYNDETDLRRFFEALDKAMNLLL